jgi:hypothetical protein
VTELPFKLHSRRVDRLLSDVYHVELRDVEPRIAVENLLRSCLGDPGLSLDLLIKISERTAGRRGTVPVETRITVRRLIGADYYSTVLATKQYAVLGFRLKTTSTRACREFTIRRGMELLWHVAGWERPVVVTCQMPTRVLWISHRSIYEYASNAIGYRADPAHLQLWAPSRRLREALESALSNVSEYPVTLSLCESGVTDKPSTCEYEALLIACDGDLSTLIYAVNVPVMRLKLSLAPLELVSLPQEAKPPLFSSIFNVLRGRWRSS